MAVTGTLIAVGVQRKMGVDVRRQMIVAVSETGIRLRMPFGYWVSFWWAC